MIATGNSNRDEDILHAVSAGAKGYLAEESSPEEFKQAIREVHAGSVWTPAHVLAVFIERSTISSRNIQPRAESKISEREREVLRLLVSGCSNREIADQLGIMNGPSKRMSPSSCARWECKTALLSRSTR